MSIAIIATPAYGASFNSDLAVMKHWQENKDFITAEGYVSKQTWANFGSPLDTLRYDYEGITVTLSQGLL